MTSLLVLATWAVGLQDTTLTEDNYGMWRTKIQLSTKDESYNLIRWADNIMDGPEAAIKKAAPILLWLGDGHPLAMTSHFGVVLRSSFFNEPGVRNLVESFCPVADDSNAIDAQRTWLTGDTVRELKSKKEGLFVIDAGSGILASTTSSNKNELVATLQKGLAAWGQLPATSRMWGDMKKVAIALKPQPIKIGPNPTATIAPAVPGQPIVSDVAVTVQGAPNPRVRPGRGQLNPRVQIADPNSNKLKIRIVSRDLARKDGPVAGPEFNFYALELPTREGLVLPTEIKPYKTVDWPKNIVESFFGNGLIDRVRGSGLSFQPKDFQKAILRTTITNITGDMVQMRFDGLANAVAEGRWGLAPGEATSDDLQIRGIDLQLLGHGRYNSATKKWVGFDMIALGTRWGGAPGNFRKDDTRTAPIGFFMSIPEGDFWDRMIARTSRMTG